ncbi:Spc24 subunit of Ndc80-domain-containing protein [Lentinula lateritia]|uniref:Spc24 subunit of Ndc80-domain-containing protein n=1 Tax=Lentinula aff. lateritia TaxID=2804960 RepID=A0ACC1U3C8_9AGAR|nr:Spc24 subunit of Ndc80-domain-containing protein [Lentinula aff. lateritia]KAJ3846208.1 Spc24 subunit of Ndc80-domain-containing protein [Lentinula lateritia]
MSIEFSETTKVIVEMAAMMDPEDDYNTIVEAEEKIKASRVQREKEIEEAHANMKGASSIHIPEKIAYILKALSKTLEAAKQSAKRPKSVPSAETHAATVNELDNSKLSLAKSISDAENMLASQEAELAALKAECQSLEHYDPATEHEKDLDGTALRLKIYKGMGFDIALDDKNQVSNVLIRSQSGDVHSVPLNVDKSPADYTRHLWKLAAS